MKKYIIILLISPLAVFTTAVYGQASNEAGSATMKLSVKQAVEQALTHNADLKKAKIDVKISQETVKQTIAIGLPQVSASFGYQQYLTIPGQWIKNSFNPAPGAPEYIFLQFQQKIGSTANISVNQLLFDGSYLVGLKATKEFMGMSQLLEAKTDYDVQLNVVKSYLMVASTQKNIDLLDANLNILEKSLNDVKALNKEGFAESLDVKRLQYSYNNLKIQKEKLQDGIQILTNALKLQMGIDVNTAVELTDDIETIDKSISFAEDLQSNIDVKTRPEYAIINQSIRLGELDKQRYKMGMLPRFVAFYQHQELTQRPEFNFFQSNLTPNNNWVPSDVIGLQVQLSIFDGLSTFSKIREVNYKLEKAKLDLANFSNAANFEINKNRANYLLGLKQASLQKENLDLAREIYEKSNLKYKEGVGSSLEIVQSESELKNAQVNYLNSMYDLVISKIEFNKSIGKSMF